MRKKVKMSGFILFLFLIIMALSGLIYESVSHRNVKETYPPDGSLVHIGERQIHVNIAGKKTDLPPVVIEAGTGSWSYEWLQFQEELSNYTQVLTYDRAGYGWSDPPGNGFSLSETVSDLHTVIEKTKLDEPAIIIAHSVGAVYARHFHDQHPEQVAGLILVDSRNEFFREDALPAYNEAFFDSQSQTMNKLLARFGVVRLVGESTLQGMPDFIFKEKYAHVHYDVPFFQVLDEEIEQIAKNVELLNELQPLHDTPLTVITPETADTQAVELGFSEEQANTLDQQWLLSQQKLTELSQNSTFITASNSRHAVMFDQPEVILDAVLAMGEDIKR